MKTNIISRLFTAAFFAACLLLGMVAGQAAEDRLTMTQDESKLEKLIEDNLTKVHDLKVTEETLEIDDIGLDIAFKDDLVPNFRMTIDTQSSNRDKDTNIIMERAVILTIYTTVKVPQDRRSAVMEVLNTFNSKMIFTCTYIETDTEVVSCWAINIMEEGMHVEYVFDAIERMTRNWRKLYPDVAKVLEP